MWRFALSFPVVILIILLTVNSRSKVQDFEYINYDDWELEWEDNFDADTINSSIWGIMDRRNDDSRRWHSPNPECYSFQKGSLILRGIKNTDRSKDTAKYLTGAITTRGKLSFSPPFRIEARVKMKSIKGAWPAIWMLPFFIDKGWPDDGEIDIMEHTGFDESIYQTLHSGYTKRQEGNMPPRFSKTKVIPSEYNVYGVDIFKDKIYFHTNGIYTLAYPRLDSIGDSSQFPFFRKWYLMIDMQLAGKWIGEVDDSSLPAEMEIDWVRYYHPKEDRK